MSNPLSRPRTFTKDSEEDKSSDSQLEFSTDKEQPAVKHGDAALEILGDGAIHFEVTEDQDRRVLRKIDMWLLPIVLLVYFLQQLDKSSLSYTSVFGIVAETGELPTLLINCILITCPCRTGGDTVQLAFEYRVHC